MQPQMSTELMTRIAASADTWNVSYTSNGLAVEYQIYNRTDITSLCRLLVWSTEAFFVNGEVTLTPKVKVSMHDTSSGKTVMFIVVGNFVSCTSDAGRYGAELATDSLYVELIKRGEEPTTECKSILYDIALFVVCTVVGIALLLAALRYKRMRDKRL